MLLECILVFNDLVIFFCETYKHFEGATTVLWNTTETGTNEWITYLLSYNEAQEHDVSGPSQVMKTIMHNLINV